MVSAQNRAAEYRIIRLIRPPYRCRSIVDVTSPVDHEWGSIDVDQVDRIARVESSRAVLSFASAGGTADR